MKAGRWAMVLVGIAAVVAALAVISSPPALSAGADPVLQRVRGEVRIDGSSTVYPITEAVAEEFRRSGATSVRVTVGISGTGGGFKRFVKGETDVSNASRPIKFEEVEATEASGVGFYEAPVAYDGLTIVVHPENDWVQDITVKDLQRMYLDGMETKSWRDIRPEWPDVPLSLYSPGTDSGTFDYFKEVVAGKTGAIRSDIAVSEDDNVLVRGVTGDRGAVGFFGFAYYEANRERVRSAAVINPESGVAVKPTRETIKSGEYAPFSRPVFIYINKQSALRREVRTFIEFYLENAGRMAAEVGYVELPAEIYERVRENIRRRVPGTQFLDEAGEKVHGSLPEVYKSR